MVTGISRSLISRDFSFELFLLFLFFIRDENVPATFSKEILVPFCVESSLSGVKESVKPKQKMVYRRFIDIPKDWMHKRLRLHFEAVDYSAVVFVNKQEVCRHTGGYDSFYCDIHKALNDNDDANEIIVEVTDPTQSEAIPVGKQWAGEPREDFYKFIYYTPTSGIWQSVWMEPLEEDSVEDINIVPDVDNGTITLSVTTSIRNKEDLLNLEILDGDEKVVNTKIKANAKVELSLGENFKTWSPASPHLYDLIVTLPSGDRVKTYVGMRKIEMKKVGRFQKVFLNNKELDFQIGLLDQGYWPDGILTAPTDDALKWDIEQTKNMGFNMIRKHIKVEPKRWYYWADKLGMLVWQDFPSITDTINMEKANSITKDVFKNEAKVWMNQLRNHPSIILWVVFNEGWGQHDTIKLTSLVMEADPSRLVTCASGWTDHPVGHVVDVHSYPGPVKNIKMLFFKEKLYAVDENRLAVVGEMWGKNRAIPGHNWFGDDFILPDPRGIIESEEQFLKDYEAAIDELVNLKSSHGYVAAVMTQTTDVEAELNGMLTYDRGAFKCDPNELAKLNRRLYKTK